MQEIFSSFKSLCWPQKIYFLNIISNRISYIWILNDFIYEYADKLFNGWELQLFFSWDTKT